MGAAIDIAASPRPTLDAATCSTSGRYLVSNPAHFADVSFHSAASLRMCRERMQQAAAAFSIVEAEVVGLHFAMPSQVEVGPYMHSDSENEPVSPHSCCGDDFSDENQSAHSDWQTALLDEDLLARGRQYDAVNIRYSRQQVPAFVCRSIVRPLLLGLA